LRAVVFPTSSAIQRCQRAKETGPSGDGKQPIGSVAPLARYTASRCATRLAARAACQHQIGQTYRQML